MDLKELLLDALVELTEADKETVKLNLVRPKDRAYGDLALKCFLFAKMWQIPPDECAEKIRSELKLPKGIKEAQTAGPYLNFKYDRREFIGTVLKDILKRKDKVGAKPANGKRIIVEYSSPNIAKTFHVGHLRTTLIGHSLVQIYKHLGFEVIGINHLGDWGTQFGFVWAGCELWGKPQNPSVEDLVEIYRKATALKKVQEDDCVEDKDKDKPDVNQMARDYFIRLQSGDKEAVKFWKWCLEISVDYLKAMYERLGITFDHYTGESFYRDMVPEIENYLRKSGILEDSEGALGVNLGKKLGFARIFTPDGRSLYITRDIAAAVYRFNTFKPDAILYVVAAQQNLHFEHLTGILKKAGHPVADTIKHISFGFVPGMSTREGGAISLKDYLAEAHQRALKTYRTEVSKRPQGIDEDEIAEAVAIGATYFYFLSHSNTKDFQFSWKAALNFQGDSGPYLQYALARINSIEEKAASSGITADDQVNFAALSEDTAYDLALTLAEFEDVLSNACGDNEPYYIAHYLLKLAKSFSKAYLELKVLDGEKEAASARLALFRAVGFVLKTGLHLIGVPAVKRM